MLVGRGFGIWSHSILSSLTFGLEVWRGSWTCGKTLHRNIWLQLNLEHGLRPGDHRRVQLDRLHPSHRGHRELRGGEHGAGERLLGEGGQEDWGGLGWLGGEDRRTWGGRGARAWGGGRKVGSWRLGIEHLSRGGGRGQGSRRFQRVVVGGREGRSRGGR